MRKKPKVSILLNCYNEERFIKRSIKSVVNQTFKNWELVVWDDASTDNTVKIIKQFKDKRIKLFRNKKNLGLGKSRIRAQKLLRGEYVAILDADDFFEKKKIQEQVQILNNHKNVGLTSTWTKIQDLNGNQVKKFESIKKNSEIKKNLIFVNSLPHSSIMYRTNLAKKVGWYSKLYNYAQDYDLTLKILKNSDFYLIKKNLTNCTTLGKNMSSVDKYKYIAIKETIHILNKNKKNYYLSDTEKTLFDKVIVISYLKLFISDKNENIFLKTINIFRTLLQRPSIILSFYILNHLNEIKKL